jgi:hypothetical protein
MCQTWSDKADMLTRSERYSVSVSPLEVPVFGIDRSLICVLSTHRRWMAWWFGRCKAGESFGQVESALMDCTNLPQWVVKTHAAGGGAPCMWPDGC